MPVPEKIYLLAFTERGRRLAARLSDFFPKAQILSPEARDLSPYWHSGAALIFVGACGIALRRIAPYIKDKKTDPAVLVMDETGRFVIPLLSGHLGGANALCQEIGTLLGAEVVLTTASDLSGLPAPDLWAEEHRLLLLPEERLPRFTREYLERGHLFVFRDWPAPLPPEWKEVEAPEAAHLLVSYRRFTLREDQLQALPRALFLGVGFNQGTPAREFEEAFQSLFEEMGLRPEAVRAVATLERKLSEEGLRQWVSGKDWEVRGFAAEALNEEVKRRRLSASAAGQHTGALAVAEPAALLSAGPGGKLLVPKVKRGNVTLAVALAPPPKGRLSVVGIGPGGLEEMTPAARKVLREAEWVVGYGRYVEQVSSLLRDKRVFVSGMTREVERVERALEWAREGRKVALVSGGDPGIYGLAGLVFELARERGVLSSIEIEVVAGLSALNACAARLGAPLMHDFAVISLSDRLTPWELIEKRLSAAAEADLVIVLFNPRSRLRTHHLLRAREILLRHRPPETPVGLVRAAGRPEEAVLLTTLGDLPAEAVDMQTTVFVGNSETLRLERWLVTPRGYRGRRF
ncbi:precorrin-3B C(17)-methyltransferase [Thermosulfurimonas marina]|uniref:Precorrin-3B C(17)-methyltransferase n=1 Tax=Thermosulfurimonas marina TaxID=2047767 RepID=A0A6H1WT75_9BACT|nr:precorrin-3B C(17)-methyltransferase [Thermosulfurimonas marina]QJA06425.1 precorrin-3B C(17)-methyltransferase [Thermosulfurimonas marina]